MNCEVLVTETQTCLLTFDTEEEAFAVRERINSVHELEDADESHQCEVEADQYYQHMLDILHSAEQ